MKNIKEYKNIKRYVADLQLERLMVITDFVSQEYGINKDELFSRTRKRTISEARRKISFLARLHFNIEGKIIAKFLNVNPEWISQMIHGAWDIINVENEYYEEIQKIMVKLQIHYSSTLKPFI